MVSLSRGPGTRPSVFESFLRSWWMWAGGVVLMKELCCALWSLGELGAPPLSLWPAEGRAVIPHRPCEPPQTGSAGGGGPLLSTPSWLMVQETISCPVNTVSAFFFLLFILLLRSLTFFEETWTLWIELIMLKSFENIPQWLKRDADGAGVSLGRLMTSVLVHGMQMKRSLDYFWTSAEMWAVHILRWKYGLYFYRAIYSGSLNSDLIWLMIIRAADVVPIKRRCSKLLAQSKCLTLVFFQIEQVWLSNCPLLFLQHQLIN